MAIAKRCDICRRYFDITEKGYDTIILGHYSVIGGNVTNKDRFDACPECVSAVQELFMNRANGKTEDDDDAESE